MCKVHNSAKSIIQSASTSIVITVFRNSVNDSRTDFQDLVPSVKWRRNHTACFHMALSPEGGLMTFDTSCFHMDL